MFLIYFILLLLYDVHYNLISIITEYICYDDACHLKPYTNISTRKDLTKFSKELAVKNMVVHADKMHMAGHIDLWCKTNYDLRKIPQLEKVCV